MFDPEFQRKALSLVMGFIMQFSEAPAEPEVQELSVNDLNVSTISVSCLKVAWDGEPDRDYYVSCTAHDDSYAYGDNMYFAFKSVLRLLRKKKPYRNMSAGVLWLRLLSGSHKVTP